MATDRTVFYTCDRGMTHQSTASRREVIEARATTVFVLRDDGTSSSIRQTNQDNWRETTQSYISHNGWSGARKRSVTLGGDCLFPWDHDVADRLRGRVVSG